MAGLRVSFEHVSRVCTIALSGELDMTSSHQVIEATENAVADRPSRVVLRMDEVTFIDSTGLRALLRSLEIAERASVPLSISKPSRAVARLLDITSTADRFAVEDG